MSYLSYIQDRLAAGDYSRSGNSLRFNCFSCGDTRKHLYISLDYGGAICFRCDNTFFLRKDQLTEMKRKVKYKALPKAKGVTKLPDDWVPLFTQSQEVLHAVCKPYCYCMARNIAPRQVINYKLATVPYSGRVYFPYWDEKGNVIYWTARAISDKVTPKSIESGGDKPLYGRHIIRTESLAVKTYHEVILVEGVFDHFTTPHSYAIIGSHITDQQVNTLKTDGIKKVYVIHDPGTEDSIRQRACRRLVNIGINAWPVYLNGCGSQDPADIGRERMSEVVAHLRALDLKVPCLPIRVQIFDGPPLLEVQG